jgi:hypothetical protein
MNISEQIAKHLREVYFGENWTDINFKDTLSDINCQEATTKIDSINTIAGLVYHTNYYLDAIIEVLKGKNLNAHDNFSFDLVPLLSSGDWEKLLNKTWMNVEILADLINELPESKLFEIFSDKKYGIYYKNLHGLIEHAHYHLGQIVIVKKLIRQK